MNQIELPIEKIRRGAEGIRPMGVAVARAENHWVAFMRGAVLIVVLVIGLLIGWVVGGNDLSRGKEGGADVQ